MKIKVFNKGMSLHQTRLGLVGGGQASLMLALKAREQGYTIYVLCKDKYDPAAQVCHFWLKGEADKSENVQKLKKMTDFLFFENEVPSVKTLDIFFSDYKNKNHLKDIYQKLSDRWTQKELLWDFQIPQVDFIKITNKDDLDHAFELFKGQFILKKRQSNKEDKDFYIIKNKKDLAHFANTQKGFESQFIIEKKENIANELSFIFFRNAKGHVSSYPAFQITPDKTSWKTVGLAKTNPKIKKLQKRLLLFLNEIDFIGPILFEVAQTAKGLKVFDVHPRLTSTGFITLNGFSVDQFELYLRTIQNLKLPEVQVLNPYILSKNLIGTRYTSMVIDHDLQGHIYWYHKKKNRPGRKLGHINYIGKSNNDLQKQLRLDSQKISI